MGQRISCVKDHVPGAARPVLTRTELEHVRRPPRRDSRSLLFGDLRRTGGPGDRTEWQAIAADLPAEPPRGPGRLPPWPPPRSPEALSYLRPTRDAWRPPPAGAPPPP